MIDFENAKIAGEPVTVRKRIQTRTKYHNLSYATLLDGTLKSHFGVARSSRDEQSNPTSGRLQFNIMLNVLGLHSHYREGERVAKNFSLLHHLMDGTMGCCGKCCTAGFLFSHVTPDGFQASLARQARGLAGAAPVSAWVEKIG